MTDESTIVCDPRILTGKPVIAGTRISVELILEELGGGMTVDEFIENLVLGFLKNPLELRPAARELGGELGVNGGQQERYLVLGDDAAVDFSGDAVDLDRAGRAHGGWLRLGVNDGGEARDGENGTELHGTRGRPGKGCQVVARPRECLFPTDRMQAASEAVRRVRF